MSQSTDLNLSAGISGLSQRTEINSILSALATLHSGSSRPSYAVADMMWLDKAGGANWILKVFDGTDDIALGTINTTSNTFTPSGVELPIGNDVVALAGNTTIVTADRGKVYNADATTGNITLTVTQGQVESFQFIVSKVDASTNAVIIARQGSETIGGATSYSLTAQGESAWFIRNETGNYTVIPFGGQQRIKVSANDTTPSFLEAKVTQGDGITLAVQNDGANENILFSVRLATDSGLEFNSGNLRVRTGTGLFRNASGLNVDVGTTANKIVALDGNARLPSLDGRNLTNLSISTMQIFTSSGSWVRPQGVTRVFVEVIGGGAGSPPSFCGQGGSYCCGEIDVSAISNVTVTVGAGGAPNTNGGTSSFGSLLTASGGVSAVPTLSIDAGGGVLYNTPYNAGSFSFSGAEVLSFSGNTGNAERVTINTTTWYNNNSGKFGKNVANTSSMSFQRSFGKGGLFNTSLPVTESGQAGAVIVYW